MHSCYWMVLALPFIAAVAYGDEKRPEELSRQYIDDFLSGDLKALFDKASPELREAIKNLLLRYAHYRSPEAASALIAKRALLSCF